MVAQDCEDEEIEEEARQEESEHTTKSNRETSTFRNPITFMSGQSGAKPRIATV